MLGHAHGRADEALALTAVLETRHCDAIVLLGDMQDQPSLLADLKDSIVPVVALWQGSSLLEVPTVDVDNRAGIRAGLEHLVGLGHERIAFVSGRLLGDIRERQAAFVEFMLERSGSLPDGYVQQVPNTPGGGDAASGRSSRWIGPRPRSSPRPTSLPSASCTRPTAWAGSSRTSCRSSGSTTSSWPATRSRP